MFNWIVKSITAQFIVPMIILILLVVATSVWQGLERQRESGIAALQERANILTNVTAVGLVEPMWNLDYQNVSTLLRPLKLDPVFLGAVVSDDKGVQRAVEGDVPQVIGTDLMASSLIVKDNQVIGKLTIAVSIAQLEQNLQVFATWSCIVAACLALVLAVILGALTYRITRPISRLTSTMGDLASGRLNIAIPALERVDELGSMARSVEVFRRALVEAEELRARQEQLKAQTEAEKQSMIKGFAASFEREVIGIVAEVIHAADGLERAAVTLTDAAGTTQKLSLSVAQSSNAVSADVHSVAAAAEELSRSVLEISQQVHESSHRAAEAVEQARETDGRFAKLSQAAACIGEVVKLITDIAGQTNLLALNAAIEAARAGEAGKGFAVVAQEVKMLAAQTSQATEEITSQIVNIQRATEESVASMKQIGHTIGSVSDTVAAIAAAVEEQGGATHEISRNVHKAAEEASSSAENIGKVSDDVQATRTASAQVLTLAKMLAAGGGRLKYEVDKFLVSVRAA